MATVYEEHAKVFKVRLRFIGAIGPAGDLLKELTTPNTVADENVCCK